MIRVTYDKKYDISQLVTSVEWSGDEQQAARTCIINLKNTRDGKTKLITSIKHAKQVRFFYEGKELFRGFVFGINPRTNGELSITCYDSNIYLVKNSDTIKFTKKKASDIIKHLCKLYQIPVGHVDDTGYVIPKHIYNEKPLYEMAVTALTTTRKNNGRRFLIGNDLGKLTLRERKKPTTRYIIESGFNLISADVYTSIEELKNKVKVIGGDVEKKPIIVTSSDNTAIKKYGILQHVETNTDEKANKAKLLKLAQILLKQMNNIETDITVEAMGIRTVTAGTVINVNNTLTDLKGTYYVTSDSHTFTNAIHTMSLQISKADDLPAIDYEG